MSLVIVLLAGMLVGSLCVALGLLAVRLGGRR
jgi:hypothetical protein